MIKLSYFYEFVTLAETLNFSKTAELQYITQPALSRHIVELEEDLGARLFDRSTRTVTLTPAGREVYEEFKKMMSCYESAQRKVKELDAGKLGSIRIYSPYYWTEQFTEPIIRRYQQANPQCNFEIFSCQPRAALDAVYEDTADIAVCYETQNIQPEIRRVIYAKDSLSVFLPETHSLAGHSSLTLNELKDEDLLRVSGYEYYPLTIPSYLQEFYQSYAHTPDRLHMSQQIDTLAYDLERYQAISILCTGISKMGRSYIKTIPLAEENAYVNMCLYYKSTNMNSLIPGFIKTAVETYMRQSTVTG